MRNLAIAACGTSILVQAAIGFGAPQRPLAPPVTQACLGDLETLLTCPPHAHLVGTECRTITGEGAWAAEARQGPALTMRDDHVRTAAAYRDNAEDGRTFEFDADGRLASWADMTAGSYDGLAVDCTPDGTVSQVTHFQAGHAVGVALYWKPDGSFAYAVDQDKRTRVPVPAGMTVRPDALCHPVHCSVAAK